MNKSKPTDFDLIADQIRALIMDEQEAIINYEEIIDDSDDEDVNAVLRDISREEKVHAGQLQELLSKIEPLARAHRIKKMKPAKGQYETLFSKSFRVSRSCFSEHTILRLLHVSDLQKPSFRFVRRSIPEVWGLL